MTTEKRAKNNGWPLMRLLMVALIAALVLPALAHAYDGHFSRYMADDYCTANIAMRYGTWEALSYWYTGWSGRYTSMLLLTLLGRQEPRVYAYVLPALVLLWYGGLGWTLAQLFRLLRLTHAVPLAALFAALATYALLDGLPNVAQALYWVTSALTYFLPLILLACYAGLTLWMLRRAPGRIAYGAALALGLVLLFVAAGCSETGAALMLTMLALAALAGWRLAPPALRPRLSVWLVAGIVCVAIGLLIMLRAPGNSAREAFFDPVAPLPVVVGRSIHVILAYIASALLLFSPLPLLTVLILSTAAAYLTPIPPAVGHFSRGRVRRLLLLALGVTVLLAASTIAPSVYALSVAPPARVYLLTQLALVGGVMVWGIVMGWGLRSDDPRGRLRRSRAFVIGGGALLAGLIVFGPLAASVRAVGAGQAFSIYAAEWDALDAQIRAARARGETRVTVAPLSVDMAASAGLVTLGPAPAAGANLCASQYYDLESLVTG